MDTTEPIYCYGRPADVQADFAERLLGLGCSTAYVGRVLKEREPRLVQVKSVFEVSNLQKARIA